MLQIRLSRVSSSEGGGGGTKPLPVETVNVACPDHLVLADLPVAKGIGTIFPSSFIKAVGRRSRRHLGERVHFCVRCDFPIAIYGCLSPCEHAFCLACARSDSSCYLCDERIQKIQTIKVLDGIFICAAPHCLKSFLKRSEFEAHVRETHADLLQPNADKEEENEADNSNISRPSSADPHTKQTVVPDSSTACSQPRPSYSPSTNSHPNDVEDKTHRHQLRELPPKLLLQLKPPPFCNRNPHQQTELQPDSNPHQGFDRPYNRFHHLQGFDNQGGLHYRRDSDQFVADKQSGILSEPPFMVYSQPLNPLQPPSFLAPPNVNQGPGPLPQFNYPPFPAEGAQPFYNGHFEIARPELPSEAGGMEHASLQGFSPTAPAGAAGSFSDGYPRPWNRGLPGMPFEPMPAAASQGIPEGYANAPDKARVPFFQGDYGRAPGVLPINSPPLVQGGSEQQGSGEDHKDRKGVLALVLLPPPPPLPPPPLAQIKRAKFSGSDDVSREGQAYGWQNEERFGSGQH